MWEFFPFLSLDIENSIARAHTMGAFDFYLKLILHFGIRLINRTTIFFNGFSLSIFFSRFSLFWFYSSFDAFSLNTLWLFDSKIDRYNNKYRRIISRKKNRLRLRPLNFHGSQLMLISELSSL